MTGRDSSRSDERLGRPSYQTWLPPVKFRLEFSCQALLTLFWGHTHTPASHTSLQFPRRSHTLLPPEPSTTDLVTSLGHGAHKAPQR